MNYGHMIQARDTAEFTRLALLAAAQCSNAVEHIAIMPLIERAAKLSNDINALLGAMEADRGA